MSIEPNPRRPSWLPFLVRAGLLSGIALGLLLFVNETSALARLQELRAWICAIVALVTTFLLWVLFMRYRFFRMSHPLAYRSSLVSESRVATQLWNLWELSSSRLQVAGVIAGTTFSLKMTHRTPWLWFTRIRSVLRLNVSGRGFVARVDQNGMIVFPAEMREALEPLVTESRECFSGAHLGWTVTVGSERIQIALPHTRGFDEAVDVANRVLPAFMNLKMPPPAGGYRGAEPAHATPEEIASIEKMADDEWAAITDVPKGDEHLLAHAMRRQMSTGLSDSLGRLFVPVAFMLYFGPLTYGYIAALDWVQERYYGPLCVQACDERGLPYDGLRRGRGLHVEDCHCRSRAKHLTVSPDFYADNGAVNWFLDVFVVFAELIGLIVANFGPIVLWSGLSRRGSDSSSPPNSRPA